MAEGGKLGWRKGKRWGGYIIVWGGRSIQRGGRGGPRGGNGHPLGYRGHPVHPTGDIYSPFAPKLKLETERFIFFPLIPN